MRVSADGVGDGAIVRQRDEHEKRIALHCGPTYITAEKQERSHSHDQYGGSDLLTVW